MKLSSRTHLLFVILLVTLFFMTAINCYLTREVSAVTNNIRDHSISSLKNLNEISLAIVMLRSETRMYVSIGEPDTDNRKLFLEKIDREEKIALELIQELIKHDNADQKNVRLLENSIRSVTVYMAALRQSIFLIEGGKKREANQVLEASQTMYNRVSEALNALWQRAQIVADDRSADIESHVKLVVINSLAIFVITSAVSIFLLWLLEKIVRPTLQLALMITTARLPANISRGQRQEAGDAGFMPEKTNGEVNALPE
jgi:CHASE3 domain sensor protein